MNIQTRSLVNILFLIGILLSIAGVQSATGEPDGDNLDGLVAENVDFVGHIGGITEGVTVTGNLAYLGEGPSLTILNVSNPAVPTIVGKLTFSDIVRDVTVSGSYAYVVDSSGLRVVNVSNPASPTEIGFYVAPGQAWDIAISGAYVYIADGYAGLRVVDVSNPALPIEVGFYDTLNYAWSVAISGSYAYIADDNGLLRVVDVSNPTSPSEVGFYDTQGHAYGVAVSGIYAYVANWDSGLRVIDVSNPTSPVEVGFYDTPEPARDVAISGSYAYLANDIGGLRVINVGNPVTPSEVGFYDTPGQAYGIAVNGNYAYVADKSAGLRVVNVSNPAAPIEVGFYDVPWLAHEVDTSDNYAYVADDDGSLRVVDVSVPDAPIEVGFYDTPGYSYGVAVSGSYAYVADWNSGLRIVDVSNPTTPVEVGFYDTPDIARSVAVSGNYAYVADSDAGLRVVDVSAPAAPIEVGFYDTPGRAYEVAVSANYVYVADGSGGLRVVDVSNPFIPTEVGFLYTGLALGIAVSGNYAYVAAESAGLRVIDVSNPASPIQVGFFGTQGDVARDVAVSGDLVYLVALYSGLRVFDVSNPANPIQEGFYNTIGYAEGVAIAGNYTYVADGEGGLLILHYTASFSNNFISGQVTDSNTNNPISEVTISDGSGHSVLTDISGSYTITNLITGTYALVASKDEYTFSIVPPVSVPPNATGVDFVGTAFSMPPIVLIPGIMGSRLSNDAGDVLPCSLRPEGEVWPNLINLPNVPVYDAHLKTLWLKNDGINPANACDHITATGIFDKFFTGIPAVDKDFYNNFIIQMLDEGFQIHVFDYDWRLKIEQIAQQLDMEINALNVPKVVLIGHSMGGLVARQYILDSNRAQKVDKVISVGSPYWGAPKLALHMRQGSLPIKELNYLTYNSTIWQLIRNSAGAMQLLPSDAYYQQSGKYFMDDTGFLDTWSETRDFFVQKNQNGTLIDDGYTFHQGIDDFRVNLSVPYYVLTANHLPTPLFVREFPCWYGGTCWDWYRYVSGDETVPWISARLSGIAGDWSGNAEVCTFSSGKGHGEFLSNENVIADVKSILNGGEPTNCVLSSIYQKSPDAFGLPGPFIQIALLGDARIEIQDGGGKITGITQAGYLVNNIPNSTMNAAELGAFVTLPANAVYTVTLYQNSDMPIQFQVTDWQASSYEDPFNPMQRGIFVDVPSASGGVADMVLDLSVGYDNLLMSIDLNNDGIPDLNLEPTSVLNPEQIADISRPVTTIAVQGEQAGNFFTGPITITLIASDTGTGVLKIEYSLDAGETWQLYTGPIQTIAEGVPVFYVRSADVAGNLEYPWPYQRLIPIQVFIPVVRR